MQEYVTVACVFLRSANKLVVSLQHTMVAETAIYADRLHPNDVHIAYALTL